MVHNEPVEHAQKITGKTTVATLLPVVRAGTSALTLHGRAAPERESYSDAFIFTMRGRRTVGKSKTETVMEAEVPGYVSNGHTSERGEHQYEGRKIVNYCGVYRPQSGYWFLSYSQAALLDVLELLPREAELSFHVYLDAGTNELLVRADCAMNHEQFAGLHCDHLYLEATNKVRGREKTRRYLMDTTVGAHNTARFGDVR
jgi:hypothetical protein